ncbi:TRM11 family SAM-dependent methyltransferase [Metallosphaera javensis (ex Sakai et al. 2022)]|uniref:TRM11 family SAM-dependent methyltransferase n=1 Tax=Metallosphaera javensis (ex Sakai et al. 2022) TaxID=2775498 RepID=UPI002584381E|nr:MAG: tRNA (guanine(10)-N2)-dimethyltransferase [Metallosphaera javensis (ex Sakai et al. 2022)]
MKYAKLSNDEVFASMAELRALVGDEVHFLTGVGLYEGDTKGVARRSSTIKVVGEVLVISHDPREINERLRGNCFSVYPDVILGREKERFRVLYLESIQGVKTSRSCQKLDLIFTDGVLLAGIREEERDSKSLIEHSRKPFSQSGTMDPYTSRLMVNLARPRRVLDPFTGLGSILIEAEWLGYRAVGLDVDLKMLSKAKVNLEYFGYSCDLIQGSATALPYSGRFSVVTDPPYGRSSNAKGMKLVELYQGFLSEIAELLEGRLVFATDSSVDWRDVIRSAGLRPMYTHFLYQHKSLSRAIYVVER